MIRTALALSAAALALAACATTSHDGWTGTDASPFDGAEQACRNEARLATEATRASVFEACMARYGWRRGSSAT